MSLKNARVIAWGFPGSFPGHFRLGVKLNEGVKLSGRRGLIHLRLLPSLGAHICGVILSQ